MTHGEFIKEAENLVRETTSALNHVEPLYVYVIWSCKTLQNSKAILSTDVPDGRLYEVTLNGDTQELYLDRYKKEQNSAHKIGGIV